MEYRTAKEMAKRWNVSDRRIREMCAEGRIEGVIREGRTYKIPDHALKPADGRGGRRKKLANYGELFSQIEAKRGEFLRRKRQAQQEKTKLQEEFLTRFIYETCRAAGSGLTLKETKQVLAGESIGQKSLKEFLAVMGMKEAFEYADEKAAARTKLSERLIKEIHARIMADRWEERGVFKDEASAKQMETLIKEDRRRRKEMHPIEADAKFFLDFLKVQPFKRGNRQTGRVILNFLLMREGYPPVSVKPSDRETYKKAAQDFYERGDSRSLTQLLAGYVDQELDRLLGRK